MIDKNNTEQEYDYVIVGSGFGGSVSALRLAEKGYKVLVLEKGQRFSDVSKFPKSTWSIRKWLWFPSINFRGPFKMTFLRHITVMSGVGVGGGSLVYANTLPVPKKHFFESVSWRHLQDWATELAPFYKTAKTMLGAQPNGHFTETDDIMKSIAKDLDREDHFKSVDVAVFKGEPGVTVKDPYFDGKGPDRAGCTHCGGCMIGCRENAKNTLDKNYLYLAEQLGVEVQPDTLVLDVKQSNVSDENSGYNVVAKNRLGLFRSKKKTFKAKKVIFSGGVTGTVNLLIELQGKSLPKLSSQLGKSVRTNNEALLGVVTADKKRDFSKGVAISSVIHTDDHSHVEPVRYSAGSGAFRLLMTPHSPGKNVFIRIAKMIALCFKYPVRMFKVLTVKDFAKNSQILLFMQTLDGTLELKRARSPLTGFHSGLVSKVSTGNAPIAFMPEATDLGRRFAKKVNGIVISILTETLFNVPTTAHILGGCCMGENIEQGVINHKHEVFGYKGLYVIDGSAISANPGVNPSLTITALAERAMSMIPEKSTR